MKQTRHLCYLTLLALSVSACVSVPNVEERLNSLDLDAGTYITRAGDTLETIAFRYKLSPNELAALNPEVARQFAPGTHLIVRAASNAPDNYRTEAAWSSQESPAGRRGQRDDRVVTAPVIRPNAIPEKPRMEEPANRSVFTPAVNAVVSDVTLLDPRKPYWQAEPQPRQYAPTSGGVPQQDAFAGREIVEEEYKGGTLAMNSQDVSDQLQPMVGRWTWPTQGQVARGFAPIQEGRHGVDIAGVPGQPVVAVMDGVVAYSGKDPSGSGNLIIIKHEDSLLTAYSHTRDLFVAENDVVRAGDPIATLGWNTQQESVLRFEVRRDGNSLNPMDFLSIR